MIRTSGVHLLGNVSGCGRVWEASRCRKELYSRCFSAWSGLAAGCWNQLQNLECPWISARARRRRFQHRWHAISCQFYSKKLIGLLTSGILNVPAHFHLFFFPFAEKETNVDQCAAFSTSVCSVCLDPRMYQVWLWSWSVSFQPDNEYALYVQC